MVCCAAGAPAQEPIIDRESISMRPVREVLRESAVVDEAQIRDAVAQRGNVGAIVAIADLAESRKGTGPHAGLYVANEAGDVFLHTSERISTRRSVVRDLQKRSVSLAPRGMAFADPYLFVYDGARERVVAMQADLRGEKPAHVFDQTFGEPSHLAVSPEGLVAVLDGQTLVLQQIGREPFRQRIEGLSTRAAGLNFSSWDTLHVLDGGKRSLITLTLNRLRDDTFRVRTEHQALPGDLDLRAMTVFEGNLYFATVDRVYAYLESDQQIVPVLGHSYEFSGIDQIALTHDALYVLHGGVLEWMPRGAPVDLVLDGTLHEGRAALLAIYRELMATGFLPRHEVRSPADFDDGEIFLAAVGAIIGPPVAPEPEVVRTNSERQKYAYQTEVLAKRSASARGHRAWSRTAGGPQRSPGPSEWNSFVCELAACRDFRGIREGQAVEVPEVEIRNRLVREIVLLNGVPLGETLEHLVYSTELEERAGPELIRRLNRDLEALSDQQLLALDDGRVTVPVEKWTVTMAVPAEQLLDPSSALRRLVEADEHLTMLSRGAFAEQSAKTARPLGGAGMQDPDDACAQLRESMAKLHRTIDYPGEGLESLELGVRVGVLENRSTLQESHLAFTGDGGGVWHRAENFALVALPTAASSVPSPVLDLAAFSKEAHHGNHVAGLIGGRRNACWSGLLPNARLVLLDLVDGGRLHSAIEDSVHAFVQVFNVSQIWAGPQDALRQTVRGDDRALWVVAVGNDGKNLEDVDIPPAMARWADFPNVLTVAAADWDGNLIQTVGDDQVGEVTGTNFGRAYVDLVAPGRDVVSAIHDNVYGPATGTSQATPQVAAAAALLVDELGARLSPGEAKARLIASARWNPNYEGKVWGGRLDFDAAVAFPDDNVLRTTTGLDQAFAVEFAEDAMLEIRGPRDYYERSGSGRAAPRSLPMSQVLSLRQRGGRFRVVLREPEKGALKILLDVELRTPQNARLACTRFQRWQPPAPPDAGGGAAVAGAWVDDGGCSSGIAVSQIEEYVRGEPYGIRWE